MNILLLGSGGREHTLAWKIAQSIKTGKLYIAPGNAGTASLGTNVNISPDDFEALGTFSAGNKIDMIVVGPEASLVNGIRDFFKSHGSPGHIKIIGPDMAGARLEGSKDYAKKFMTKYGIPTAAYKSFSSDTVSDGFAFLGKLTPPYVLKADGLAAGKGVLIMEDLNEAKKSLTGMLEGKFGAAGKTVVIEEYLKGIEVSVFILTDGKNYKLLPEAKDYKRIGEGDKGLNTGGMGAVSPVRFADKAFINKVEERIIRPTMTGLHEENIDYRGFIFFGLMNVEGEPYVIEYNVRMGDPEAEVVIPRIETDIVELFESVADGTLDTRSLIIDERTLVTVMLVSEGYPGNYEKGRIITGLDRTRGSIIFHAGTKLSGNDIVTNGGRVIAVSSFGKDMAEALEISYSNASVIGYDGKYYRKDIGFDLCC